MPPDDAPLRRRMGSVAAASALALIVGELVTFGQTIALARLLSPTEVGWFVAGTVLVMFLGNFVEGGLRSGLIQRDTRLPDAAETVFWVTMVSGLAMSLATLAVSPLVGWVFHSPTVGAITAATAGVLFIYSFSNVPEALLQREFSVRRRLIVGPATSVAFASVAVTMAALGFGVWAMVAGLYASHLVTVIAVWVICPWRPGRGRASIPLWRELARYGLPLVLGMIGARIQNMLEAVVVGRGLSSAALGNFRYGQRISQIPVRAIIEVGAIALFPAFSRIAGDAARLLPAYLRALRWATVGATALTGLMIAVGKPAVVVMFGERWREAGTVVVAMAGLGLGKAWISVSEEVIKGGGRTRLLNWYTLIEVTLGIGLLLALIGPFGLVGVGLSVSITALLVGVTCIVLARHVVRYRVPDVLRAVLPALPCGVGATALTIVAERGFGSDQHGVALGVLTLTIDAVVFLAAYVTLLALVWPAGARAAFTALSTRLGNATPR